MKTNYLSYLLRVWQTGSGGPSNWVASLEDPHTHQVTHFGSLDALLQFLRRSTGQGEAGPKIPASPVEKEGE